MMSVEEELPIYDDDQQDDKEKKNKEDRSTDDSDVVTGWKGTD